MTQQSEALRHADKLDAHEFDEPHGAAAELRRLYMVEKLYQAALEGRNVMHLELHKANADRGILQAQRDEARRTVREAHEAGTRLTAQRDLLLEVLKSELRHAEWQDKIIYPVGSEEFQNWRISIYLPVPLSASDKSPQAALDRLVDAAIKAMEEGNE